MIKELRNVVVGYVILAKQEYKRLKEPNALLLQQLSTAAKILPQGTELRLGLGVQCFTAQSLCPATEDSHWSIQGQKRYSACRLARGTQQQRVNLFDALNFYHQ